ncbi:flavin-dependent dehydrogenase [Paraburkholderia sp. GAS206C]
MADGHLYIVVARGGLGGAAPGRSLAIQGARPLIVELEAIFESRVHGVGMYLPGVAEARRLSADGLLCDSGAHNVRDWNRYFGPVPRDCRDLVETTAACSSSLNFRHPLMQRTLLDAAETTGVVVRRGTTFIGVEQGNSSVLRLSLGIRRSFATR